ncbi:lysylphosphatidylglycerol synthase transmembrane domain-containing protein [Rhodospira trueperi]|uniref:Lysylphosphatidylglycerol synthase TM region n=1 Tax=Rhodospira trueperi TaxID=69960 RepID=A0A1G7FK26_9PROT|nr:lysylphosphatidylglycerol synthase transmembrane domain-containing protein [Rhodospira trueperi]SDE76244.1 hypothetical protein SAMN05421720_111106 [Rhodospira trueperi]
MTDPAPAPSGARLLPALAWQVLMAVVVCAALLAWLATADSFDALLPALTGVDPWPVLGALGLYPLMTLSRACRLRAALGGPVRLWPLTQVAALHSMLASFAPMRLGELSLVWLLHRAAGTPLVAGSALLLVLRLIDLVVVLAAGMFALALLPAARSALPDALPWAGAAAAVLVAGLMLAPRLAGILARLTPLDSGGRLGRVWVTLLEALTALTPGRLARLLAWSLVIWGLIFLMAWLCANATPAPVGLAGGVAGGSATALASVLPVNTFANAGTFEAAWVLALMPAGLEEVAALATGIVFHAMTLAGSAALGAIAVLTGGWPTRAPSG